MTLGSHQQTVILVGDCRSHLAKLKSGSVHCVVTSPPYWGLRDYNVAGQIGLEQLFADYIEAMRAVFAEVMRVLRPDGTLWLNLGDTYSGGGNGGGGSFAKDGVHAADQVNKNVAARRGVARYPVGLKPKDLCGIPWRVAFALQADGWHLRQDIIWAKPNPMPESVTDRCTKAHEYLFLFSKSGDNLLWKSVDTREWSHHPDLTQRLPDPKHPGETIPRWRGFDYYFDAEAIKEPAAYNPEKTKFPDGWDTGAGGHGSYHRNGREKGRRSGNKNHKGVAEYESSDSEEHRTKAGLLKISETAYATRNKRSVWSVAPFPFKEAHFATFPPKLVEPCVLAGCPEGGVVLDPFGGAGTVGLVANRLNRHAVLIELNPTYAEMARARIDRELGQVSSVVVRPAVSSEATVQN